MTVGALIFAFNNSSIDYVSMAAWSAKNVRRHLNIPTCLVTNSKDVPDVFDHVVTADPAGTDNRYHHDLDATVPWYNANRVDAYSLTPWDQTLVLDADYVVACSILRKILESPQDFMCHRMAYDIVSISTFDELNWFGKFRMPMWWATVMMFRKSNTAHFIFDSMQMIRNNWQHYCNIYGIQKRTYRNDHALSISLALVSGHSLQVDDIPWLLPTLVPEHKLNQIDDDAYRVDYTTSKGKKQWMRWNNMDFHAMGKAHLGGIIANSR